MSLQSFKMFSTQNLHVLFVQATEIEILAIENTDFILFARTPPLGKPKKEKLEMFLDKAKSGLKYHENHSIAATKKNTEEIKLFLSLY